MKKEQKNQYLKAKRDIDAAIRRHGFAAVKWVVNRRGESESLKRKLVAAKKRLTAQIEEIESKLRK